ncbi:MAG: hypothetical protein E7439_06500 [Ruminococcaceae bacterium]|nr:hypothetical protein [Oscillospiraceae bacterium]
MDRTELKQEIPQAEPAVKAQKPENVLLGTLGAVLGAVIGIVCILLFRQMGFVAALSGAVLAICTMKGYSLLGGKLSLKGMLISAGLMLIAPYIAYQLSWAFVILERAQCEGMNWNFFQSLLAIYRLTGSEVEGIPFYIESAGYWVGLVQLYLFTVFGAFGILFDERNKLLKAKAKLLEEAEE